MNVTKTPDPINPSEWTTLSEAARILGCSHQNITQGAERGVFTIIRPWPHVALVSNASIEAWRNGVPRKRVQPFDARDFVVARINGDLETADPADVLDLLLEFIVDARPGWSLTHRIQWAKTTQVRMWRTATV